MHKFVLVVSSKLPLQSYFAWLSLLLLLYEYAVVCIDARNKKKDFCRRFNRSASRYCMTYSSGTLSHFSVRLRRDRIDAIDTSNGRYFSVAWIFMCGLIETCLFLRIFNKISILILQYIRVFVTFEEAANTRKYITQFIFQFTFCFCTLRDILILL